MQHTRKPPPDSAGGGGIGGDEHIPPKPARSHRQVLARVPLGSDELVLSVDDRDRLDVRLWTRTAGVRMASRYGLTIPFADTPKLIEALQRAMREEAAT